MPCDANPCQNGAVCLLEDERPVCYCVPDYHGALCELRYDDCESKFARCENGGTCIDGINSFACSCPLDYGGPMCEYSLTTTTVEAESDRRTVGFGGTTAAITEPAGSAATTEFSVRPLSPPTSTTSFTSAYYWTTSPGDTSSSSYTRKYAFTGEETTSTSMREADGGTSGGAEAGVSPTDGFPSMGFTGKDTTSQEVLVTSESATTAYASTEASTGGIELYLPTGRSFHDSEVTEVLGDYDRTSRTTTTMTTYPAISDRTGENATELATDSR